MKKLILIALLFAGYASAQPQYTDPKNAITAVSEEYIPAPIVEVVKENSTEIMGAFIAFLAFILQR